MTTADDNPASVTIEVCQRTGDWWYDNAGRERPKYHAQIKDHPELWAAGYSLDDAIGNLVRCHPERFGVTVEFLGRLHR